jgi:hypothetical protein
MRYVPYKQESLSATFLNLHGTKISAEILSGLPSTVKALGVACQPYKLHVTTETLRHESKQKLKNPIRAHH